LARQGAARIKERGAAYHAHNGKGNTVNRQNANQLGYFRGIPTKIDVDRLDAKFGVPKEGDEITFAACSDALGMPETSHRFRTVVHAWRKKLFRDHNLLSVGTGEGAFRFADPAERIDFASRKVKSGRRSVGYAVVIAHGTDARRLTADQQKTRAGLLELNAGRLRLAAAVMK